MPPTHLHHAHTTALRVDLWLGLAAVGILLASLLPTASFTAQREDAAETAKLLALLLDAGRMVVATNQDLINDPSKGDKGFTPEAFEKQLADEFRTRTGLSLTALEQEAIPPMARPLLLRLMEECKKTILYHQPVINIPGVRYKGVIPATFATETATRFQTWSGVYLKQVAPPALLRNPKNGPDEYEATALSRLTAHSDRPEITTVLTEIVDQGKSVRALLPLYYGKSCLACHGEPKGERDVSGYPREGAKEGDLGGAISVKISLK